MKRVLIFSTILILLQPFKLSAQKAYAIDKGSIIIGGSLSYTSTGNKDQVIDRIQTITICPGCVFFIVPHLAIGGELKLIHTEYSEYSVKCYGIGPTISYYFGTKNDKEYPFLSFSYLRIEEGGDEGGIGWTLNRQEYCVTGGVAFMIAHNVAIEPKLFFSIASIEDQKDNNTYGIELGIATFIF